MVSTSFLITSLLVISSTSVSGFSADADLTRGRLSQAFSSPSGKLTFSPEIVIPEPQDPTALLLLSNAVQTLSGRIRECKSNAAFVQGSVTALQTFANEQESARGNFPGPVPVVYCSDVSLENIDSIAETGADGVMVRVCGGEPIASPSDLQASDDWSQICQAALKAGLQPIPEVTLSHEKAADWGEDQVTALVEELSKCVGATPVSVILTVNPVDAEQEEPVALPAVPKALGKTIPILGSVRVTAGENRLSDESQRFKQAGFTGTVLRSDCVPGFRMNLDLEIVGRFWAMCINDLKSTKSKSFSFRSKNNMEKSAATNWFNYQKGVIESGALGDPEDSYSIVDDSIGEYKGFA